MALLWSFSSLVFFLGREEPRWHSMSHIWMTHVWYMDESWRTWISYGTTLFFFFWRGRSPDGTPYLTYEWLMSDIWMSHGAHEWVMAFPLSSLLWGRGARAALHVSHMNKPCLTYEWVMSHIWMSHVSYMNESCLTYEWVMSYIWMSHSAQKTSHVTSFVFSLVVRSPGGTWSLLMWIVTHIWLIESWLIQETFVTS